MAADDPETIEVRPDERLDLGKLEPYLRARLPGARGPLEVAQFGGGYANLTYLVRIGEREFVLRRPPLGPVAAGAHDMGREHRVLSVLYRGYPLAPRSLLLCTDHGVIGADFLVMERRRGIVIRDDLPARFQGDPNLARRVGETIVDCLAALHLVDPDTVGLGGLGRPEGFARRQVEGWSRRWEAAKDKDVAGIDRLAAWLAANLPEPCAATFVHNDFKLDNMLVESGDPGRAVAVLDWDMCTTGDPLMDLGYLLNVWVEAGDDPAWRVTSAMPTWRDGFMSRAGAVERYRRLTGFDVGDLAWYQAFGAFKFAVVLAQIRARWLRGQTRDSRFASLGPHVEVLIAKGLALAGISR